MKRRLKPVIAPAEMRRRAEARLRARAVNPPAQATGPEPATNVRRLYHELQVHQVELELQNAELQQTRDELEISLANYTDLYDFAPVGYFTLAASGTIGQVNLTGASLVGIERAGLVGQSFGRLVPLPQRPAFQAFLKKVFAGPGKQSLDLELISPAGQPVRTVNLKAQRLFNGQECRVAVVDITDRKRAEDIVRVSEIRFRRLFETAHDGVLLLNPATGKITDANPFMTKLLGYPNDQLVGKELFQIGLLKDEVASQEMFRKLKLKHEVRYEDLPLESQGGRHQEVEVVANLYQENGHAVIQCNIRDITARKSTEHELAEKARLLDLSHDAIIVRDMQGHIRYWNHGAEELYGWSRKEALGKVSNLLLQTKYPIPLKQMIEELHRTDRWTGELVHVTRAGRRLTVLTRKTLDRDRRGRPVAVLENITDISARKAAEEMLRRNEVLFAALIEQAPVGVYVVDAQFRLQQVNRKALPVFKKIHPLIGRDFSEINHIIWPQRVADAAERHFRHTLKTGEAYQAPELAARRRDTGAQEIYEWQIQRVTLPAGEHGVVCFFSNITERKLAEATQRRLEVLAASNLKLRREIIRREAVEAALKQSEAHQLQLLAESRQMQEQLRHLSRQVLMAQEEERKRISRELHDVIAQTLTGINVQLDVLKKEAGCNPDGFEQKIARTQQLVGKSVDLVHRFARELRPAVLDDLGLIPALHAFMKEFTTQTGVRTSLTAFARVETVAIAHRTVLFRVAQEALTNVARHAHASRVEVRLEKIADRLCLTVKDDGQSFAVPRVLGAAGSKRLGLLGMRERVEMVGGTFGIASAPGQGTTVRVELPFAEAPKRPLKKAGAAAKLKSS